MADTDVARNVEAASLTDMRDMDIDDVYVLMDVQMGERPGPRELYKRWEKQNWEAYAIDFSEDKAHWQGLPDEFKREILFGLHAFFLGEVAVTDTLSPLVHAAPTEEDRQFLSTQLVDEARHAIFFDRVFQEILGVDGIDGARSTPEIAPMLDPQERGYGRLFYRDLPELTERVRREPESYPAWVDGIVCYHMIIEGVLALYGQRQLLKAARAFGILPGFRAGFTAVTRDESRHVNYGVFALRAAQGMGLHDQMVETSKRLLDGACDLLTRPLEKIELPPDEVMELLPPEIRDQSFMEEWRFPMEQLRKRYKNIGISADAIAELDKQWWDRIETNLDDYEDRFGEPHPARVDEDEAAVV